MKYKLLKETPWVADGAIIEFDKDSDNDVVISNDSFKKYRDGKDYASETYDWIRWLIENHTEDFEEVKETPKPKWKVGDCVVNTNDNSFTQIFSVSKKSDPRIYNNIYTGQGYFGILERDLRDPTPDELATYFT